MILCPKDILDRAAERGTTVHAICAAIAKGSWITEGMIQEDLRGYVESFRKFAKEHVYDYEVIEQRYHEDDLKYSGQVDLVIETSSGNFKLVDLKTTSTMPKTHLVQMAAYEHLLSEHEIYVESAMLVYLNKNGDFPKIIERENLLPELDIFFHALDCYNYFNAKKVKKDD